MDLLRQRAHCYIILKELNSALQDLNRILEIAKDDPTLIDKEALQALKTATMGQDGEQGLIVSNNNFEALITKKKDGNIFRQSDLLFFSGVNEFYLKNYDKAITLWEQSYQLKKGQKQKQEELHFSDQTDRYSEIEDLEFEDRTYTIYELEYNLAIGYIQLGQLQKAKQNFQNLKSLIGDEEEFQNNLEKFIKTLDNEINGKKQSEKVKQLFVFPYHNRLCSIYPIVKLKWFETRLSFCLPRIKAPEMQIRFENKLIQSLAVFNV